MIDVGLLVLRVVLGVSYEFNLALAGMALTLLIAGAGAYSLDGALGILW